MEDIRTVTKLTKPDSWFTTIDLKNAYFLISVAQPYQKYLRFQQNNVLYEFTCLPFGLSVAPYIFTKIMKPVLRILRTNGILCVNYLDDFLIIADTKLNCISKTSFTIRLLESLGFLVNWSKSVIVPSQQVKFLGFQLCSQSMTLSLPRLKQNRLRETIHTVMKRKTLSIRDVAQLLGVLISSCPAIKYSWLYTKPLERDKLLALRSSSYHYGAKMQLSPTAITDLHWWLHHLATSNPIPRDQFDLEIFTDSCLTGWGAYCEGERTNGWWPLEVSRDHINVLELRAIFYGLQSFAKTQSSITVLIRSDNSTAISYINRMGSVQHPTLSQLARTIWQWCEERDIWLYASYVSSASNYLADF